MTAKDLKNALLQEAVQGKLVPQIASEGNARDLLEEIRKEKVVLIKSGDIKKEKPLPEITEDEIPFDIPENWCWCRLGEVVDTNIGLTYSPTDIITEGGTAVLRSNNIQDGKIVYEDLVHVSKKVPEKCLSKKGDLLICARNGSKALVGKSALIEQDGMAFGAFMALVRSPINPYILYFINSPVYRSKLEGVNTTTINQITQDNLRETLFPLPPLSEQKRIVAAIEKFMPLIEEYGKKETVLNQLNAEIGTLTKKAILQEAVQGKLVPQDSSEGNAKELLNEIKAQKEALIKAGKIKKEKPLPEITDDEIPFDIPENWCWCRLDSVCNKITDMVASGSFGDIRENVTYYKEINYALMVKTADFSNNFSQNLTYTDKHGYDYLSNSNLFGGELILSNIGSIGKVFIVPNLDIPMTLAPNSIMLRIENITVKNYLRYLFSSDFGYKELLNISSGTTMKKFNKTELKKILIPFPPLSEQKRIVSAIEQLLPLCEKLGKE